MKVVCFPTNVGSSIDANEFGTHSSSSYTSDNETRWAPLEVKLFIIQIRFTGLYFQNYVYIDLSHKNIATCSRNVNQRLHEK